MPTVSLLVPVFNRADLVGDCIQSVLDQTFDDLEVVVVDGASTDGTWDVCQAYARLDPRVRIWRDPRNAGPVKGWWRCVEEARGQLATFVWSDDLLMPAFLESLVGWLESDDIAFAYSAVEIGPQPGEGAVSYALPGVRVMSSDAFIAGSLSTRGRFPVSPACALFRLDDLRRNFMSVLPIDPQLDLSKTGAGTDLLLLLNAAASRSQVAHVAEPLAFFREHPGSITVQARDGAVSHAYAMTKAWFARSHGRPDLIPTALAWYWLGDMRRTRTLQSPRSAASQYGNLASPSALLLAAIRVVGGALRDRSPWKRTFPGT